MGFVDIFVRGNTQDADAALGRAADRVKNFASEINKAGSKFGAVSAGAAIGTARAVINRIEAREQRAIQLQDEQIGRTVGRAGGLAGGRAQQLAGRAREAASGRGLGASGLLGGATDLFSLLIARSRAAVGGTVTGDTAATSKLTKAMEDLTDKIGEQINATSTEREGLIILAEQQAGVERALRQLFPQFVTAIQEAGVNSIKAQELANSLLASSTSVVSADRKLDELIVELRASQSLTESLRLEVPE